MTGFVGRAGLKLEAAIERFGLAERVRGAAAIDVGAAAGGFTECLLRCGARTVTAVDVGHGQMDAALARDPRVFHLEGADWKTLSLSVAAGPFDFFTVDVSFVSARNMLRGLAFRLRDGAHGVVLVKPQFELPPRGGRTRADATTFSDAERAEAVRRVRAKAESLGFALVAHDDSPVAGREGTVEALAHLRFDGRSRKLPLPGERRGQRTSTPAATGARSAAVAATKTSERMRWFVVAAPGIEAVTLREASLLPGVTDARAVEGGVELSGTLEVGCRANLWLRTASRVLARVGEVTARDFDRLRRQAAGLPWELFVAAETPVEVTASASRCRLYHTGALAENVALAISDRLGGSKTSADTLAPLKVLIRGVNDRFTLSVDASGDLLHRRGWRQETARAPLRETLAAALIELSGWDTSTPFVDPMCGAGTLPLEACARALGVAPGGGRRDFAGQRWPLSDPALWQRLRDEAAAARRESPPAPIAASDRDPDAVAAARRNAERAGFAAHVDIVQADLGDVRPPSGPGRGVVLLNPPYGRRLEGGGSLGRLYRDIGRVLRDRFRGWRAAVLTANPSLADALRLTPASCIPLRNGGLRIRLLLFDVA